MLNTPRTRILYFRTIAGVIPRNFKEIIATAELRYGPIDAIVTGTHDGFCGSGGCGGQDLYRRIIAGDSTLHLPPELRQTRDWVMQSVKSADTRVQAIIDGEDAVNLSGKRIPVLVTSFNTSDQRYRPMRFYTSGQGWSESVSESQWQDAATANWKSIPAISESGMPESMRAFLADNAETAIVNEGIAIARNFKTGQGFPEVVVTDSLRPIGERLPSTAQGERFVITELGISSADANAQAAYGWDHMPSTGNARFLFENPEAFRVYAPSLDINPALKKWAANPAMGGEATAELWQDMQFVGKATLRPAGVPVTSLLMRGGGAGVLTFLPGVFFEALKLANREDAFGSQSHYAPNAASNALPKEFGLELSPVFRFHTGPDFMTLWSQLIDRVPGGEGKACIKRALTDVSNSLLLITQDIPTMLSVCPNIWPPKPDIVGAAIIYAVPGTSQQPITVAYRDGKWVQVSGSKLEYQLRVMNKAGIPFQAIFQMAIVDGKETHTFVRLVCGPPGYGDKLAICPK